jgi:hypothetical protein
MNGKKMCACKEMDYKRAPALEKSRCLSVTSQNDQLSFGIASDGAVRRAVENKILLW